MKHSIRSSHLAVLFGLLFEVDGGTTGRLRGHDGTKTTHPPPFPQTLRMHQTKKFVDAMSPSSFRRLSGHDDQHLATHPYSNPTALKKNGSQTRQSTKVVDEGVDFFSNFATVEAMPLDAQIAALKKYGWSSPSDEHAAATIQQEDAVTEHPSSPVDAGVDFFSNFATVEAMPLDAQIAALKKYGWSSPSDEHAATTIQQEDAVTEDASSPGMAVIQQQTTKKIKMCSVNQRLCANEALNLYRLGHVMGSLLDRHRVTWWATGGTLLGAIRNKGIIPHDDDIDYNILWQQGHILQTRSFSQDLKKNGLRLHTVQPGFWQIKPVRSDGDVIHVDIFAMQSSAYKNQLCYPHGEWSTNTFPLSLCPLNQTKPQRLCPLLVRWPFGKSGTVWGPPDAMAKSYLNQAYGADWHIPKCEDSNHPCGLIQNITHDATECAEPSEPLLEAK